MLPNLVIAGVPKAGTTSLFRYLAGHPDICASSSKEAQYFRPLLTGDPPPPIEEYHSRFRGYGGQRYILEATPEYLYGGTAVVEAMCGVLSNPKIILILREPISRLTSFYRFHKAHLRIGSSVSLREYVSLCRMIEPDERLARRNSHLFGLHGGLYAQHLPPWVDRFGASLRVLFFDDLTGDRTATLTGLASWLEIDAERFNPVLGIENPSHGYRSAALQRLALAFAEHAEGFSRRLPRAYKGTRSAYLWLNGRRFLDDPDPQLRDELENFYAPSNRRLGQMLFLAGYGNIPLWARPPSEALDRRVDPTAAS